MKKLTAVFFCVLMFGFSQLLAEKITILHVSDTHSNLAPGGERDASLKAHNYGIARGATYIKQIKSANPQTTLLLHSGDISIGDMSYVNGLQFAGPELKILNDLNFDAMALGNHEFDLTPTVLSGVLGGVFKSGDSIPVLSANLNVEADGLEGLRRWIEPFVIKDYGFVKIGIFGMITPSTMQLSQPSPAVIETNPQTIIQLAGEKAQALKQAGCDIVIMLSHLGKALDMPIAINVPGIDIILGGHDHTQMQEQILHEGSGCTWVIQSGNFWQNLSKIELDIQDKKLNTLSYTNVALDATIQEDPDTKALVDLVDAGLETAFGKTYTTDKFADVEEEFTEVPFNLFAEGNHDTPVGKLVTDAFRDYTKTDIAIEPCGSTAQPLYKGPVIGLDLYRMIGYGYNTTNYLGYILVTFKISGAELIKALEICLSQIEYGDDFFPQVSGMKFSYNPNATAGERVILPSVIIGTDPIDPSKTYTVTANEFVANVLSGLKVTISDLNYVQDDMTEFQALFQYIKNKGTIKPTTGDDRISPVRDFVCDALPGQITISPNPGSEISAATFAVTSPGFYRLELYDVTGQKVASISDGYLDTGSHTSYINSSTLPQGLYMLRLTNGRTSLSASYVVVR